MAYNRFSEEDDKTIKENYPTMRRDICKLFPDRTPASVMARVNKLGLKLGKETDWTPEEDRILRENYFTMATDVQKLLPNRSLGAITVRASKLHLKTYNSWTRDEDLILRKNNLEYNDDLLELLDRDKSSILLRIQQLQKKAAEHIVYPLNVYIAVYGDHKGYDLVYRFFEDKLEDIYTKIKSSTKHPEMADKVVSVLTMYYKEQMDIEDIASEMNITPSIAKQLQDKGITILKRVLPERKKNKGV